MLPNRSDFPKDFLFGAATSSYQIEGHAFGGAGRTHWDDFAATPGNVVRAENGALWPATITTAGPTILTCCKRRGSMFTAFRPHGRG